MDAIAFIFARGDSKGLPGKNIKLLNGRPLIGWAIEQAMAVQSIRRVIVSTDSEVIAEISREYGAEVPFIRPIEMATDSSPEWMAWKHGLTYLKDTEGKLPTAMISVPATAPLRLSLDIENCMKEYEKGDADTVITVTDAHRNPYFNMVAKNSDGTVGLVNSIQSDITRRQDAPKVFDMATVCYVIDPKFVFAHKSIFEGRVKSVHVPPERAIDIDTLMDFQIAECLMKIREEKQ